MSFPKHIAIVHDWLVSMRGGEKVLEGLCELFPDATLFTLVHRKGAVSLTIERMKIETSFIQHLPFGKEKYQYFLPLYPLAASGFNLTDFDLVITSSSAAAKGVRFRKGALHICYCHTPMRYIWDQYDEYFGPGKSSFPVRTAMKMLRGPLQRWDKNTSKGVHHFIANSRNVQDRIQRLYDRQSTIIYPPVDVERFESSTAGGDYFLIVSALVPYKRIDLAVEAFNEIGERLIVVGEGMELKKIQSMAKKNIEFAGHVGDQELRKLYKHCSALIFPGEEDFGIVPVEAMACGKPVIAYAGGGALETVVDGLTGLFFREQTATSLQKAVAALENKRFDSQSIRNHALKFRREFFLEDVSACIHKQWEEHERK